MEVASIASKPQNNETGSDYSFIIKDRNPFNYQNLTPMDTKNRQFGNASVKNSEGHGNQVDPQTLLKPMDKLSPENMISNIFDRLQKKVKREEKQKREVDHDFKYKMLGGIGPANVGTNKWNEKMALYKKAKAVGNKNDLVNTAII